MSFDSTQVIRRLLSSTVDSIFDAYIREVESYFTRSCSTISAVQQRDSKRAKGTVWELFCREWLRTDEKYTAVWMLNEVPAEVATQLSLSRHIDNGIDLVAQTTTGYVAIQCKYRGGKTTRVDWSSLSTFIGLCARTGPWEKHLVITNCSGVTRKIPAGPKDKSVCRGTFRNTKRERWMQMCGTFEEHRLGSRTVGSRLVIVPALSVEEIREARIRRLAS